MKVFINSFVLLSLCLTSIAGDLNQPWKRRTIDKSSRGADGTRLADVNGDGLPDIVTGWEQGGVTRLYLNPGPDKAKELWPAVTVGEAKDVEDAVFVDLDRDGRLDVVSSCEGKNNVMLVHWAPKAIADLLNPKAWETVRLPASDRKMHWMFATPMDVNHDGRVDLLAGGKGPNSELGWWEIPENARDLTAWKWHKFRVMGWLMSLETADMDGDGDEDVLFTDRKGRLSGCYWLENPVRGNKAKSGGQWREHPVSGNGKEVMFLKRCDLDQDGLEDVLIAVRPKEIVFARRLDATGRNWKDYSITLPEIAGDAKAMNAADFDGDGKLELVFTTERADKGKQGVCRLVPRGKVTDGNWDLKPISGVDGVKHDLVELLDLDGDGDLDVLTCEEVRNLGVIWYENPLK